MGNHFGDRWQRSKYFSSSDLNYFLFSTLKHLLTQEDCFIVWQVIKLMM